MNKYKSSPICIKNWFPKLSSQLFCVHCTVYEKTLCLSFCDLKSNEKLYTKRSKMAECHEIFQPKLLAEFDPSWSTYLYCELAQKY